MLFFPWLVPAWSQENINRIEAQLPSIMVKNPKKSRPTCTKAFKQHAQVAADMKGDEGAQEATDSTKGDKKEPEQAEAEALDGVELEIWEISDGEQDPPALQDVAGSIAFKLLFIMLADGVPAEPVETAVAASAGMGFSLLLSSGSYLVVSEAARR